MSSFVPLNFSKQYEKILDDAELRKRVEDIFDKLDLKRHHRELSKSLIPLIKRIFPLISNLEAGSEVKYLLWLTIINLSRTYDSWEKQTDKNIMKLIYSTAQNICYNQLERNQVHYTRELQTDFGSPTEFHKEACLTINADFNEALQRLNILLEKRLTKRQYEIFNYRVIHDWSHEEIADHLGISYSSSTTI